MSRKLLAGFFAIFFSQCVFALGGCGGAGCGGSCFNPYACPRGACAKWMHPCQCVDQGWHYNDCIDVCKYCMAFGNVGGNWE